MNVFIIPSIYPSKDAPLSGSFIQEQVRLLAEKHQEINFGVCLWGQNEKSNQLWFGDHFKILGKYWKSFKRKSADKTISNNYTEFYEPRFYWSEKWLNGNISSLANASYQNIKRFEKKYGKVDIIHAHVSYPGGYIAKKLSDKLGIPFVITEHMSRLRFEEFVGNKNKYYKNSLKALNQAHSIVAVSNSLKEHLYQFRSKGIKVIPNPIDESFFIPKSVNKERGVYILFSATNILHSKGVHELLETIARVKRVFPTIKLRIAGDGKDLNYYKQKALKLKIHNNIEWLGEIIREQVREEMHYCDVYVSTSHHETFGLSLAEALACGKPILCTYSGGPEDIIDECNGVIANVKDSVDSSKKLIYLLENLDDYDPSVIRSHFENRFSSSVVTKQIVDFYKNCLNG